MNESKVIAYAYFHSMKFEVITSFGNYIEANIILARLKGEGIRCYLEDENVVTLMPHLSGFGGIRLAVVEDDVPKTKELLYIFHQEYIKAAICPQCGTSNIQLVPVRSKVNLLVALFTWNFTGQALQEKMIYQCQKCHWQSEELPERNDEADKDLL